MDLMESVGKLLEHADKSGTVSEAIKDLFVMLKEEAGKGSPIGLKVKDVLERLGNTDDPFYTDMPMMERVQVASLAHSAVRISEV